MAAIGLLGEVTAHVGGQLVDLGPARQRCVLAALAVNSGRVVPLDRLAERVWTPETAPQRRGSLHTYLSRLRRILADDDVDIARRSGGYVLMAGATDLDRFRELCTRARRDADDVRAERLLTEALELWRDEALTGLDGDWVQAERDRLHQERSAAEHALTSVRLRLGQGEQLLATLSRRVALDPLDELAAAQYLLALYRAGRTADALAYYHQLREQLVAELGTDPGAALQALHRQILGADPALAGGSPTVNSGMPVPRQLPAAPLPFVGRDEELDRLDTALDGAPMVITAAAGVGKTSLALHWAHRHVDRFADGQLFVDLEGFGPTGQPMTPGVALRGFLDALGVDPGRVPVDVHAQAALFRSLVAGQRILVLLDNAASTAQVAPLLPGGKTCTVVVTSRHPLHALVTVHSGRPLLLDVLPEAHARELLSERLGPARIEAEPAAVTELIRQCGGFPLALSIVAGHVVTNPRLWLADLHQVALDALDREDLLSPIPATRPSPGQTPETLEELGGTYEAAGRLGDACEVWQEAVELYLAQQRTEAAEQLGQRLEDLAGRTGSLVLDMVEQIMTA